MGWHRCSIGRSHVEAHGASRWQSPSIPYPKAKKNTRGGGPSIVAEGVINEKGISRQPPRVGIAQAAQASTPSTSSFPPKIFTFLPSLDLRFFIFNFSSRILLQINFALFFSVDSNLILSFLRRVQHGLGNRSCIFAEIFGKNKVWNSKEEFICILSGAKVCNCL